MPSLLVAIFIALLVSGCANLAYYAQAVGGQMRVMTAAQPIDQLMIDPATAPELRRELRQAAAIRDFASRELALPANGSYRAYADLGRPYALWNVFAAPEFSVEPEQWCPLFVGCVNYRGYYAQEAAERLASELRRQGFDTYLGGVPAYSTLGFFDDPLLNTFLRFGEQEVARVIFHELAHQRLYVKGDSAFNESFATSVENAGLRRWLGQTGTPDQLRAFETRQERKLRYRRLIAGYHEQLRDLYRLPLAPEEKRREKAALFAELQHACVDLQARWGDSSADPAAVCPTLNNAALSAVTLYTRWVPAFDALLAQEGGNLSRFYRRVARLAELPQSERTAALAASLPAKPAATSP
jgi:predicted aminopeptidase